MSLIHVWYQPNTASTRPFSCISLIRLIYQPNLLYQHVPHTSIIYQPDRDPVSPDPTPRFPMAFIVNRKLANQSDDELLLKRGDAFIRALPTVRPWPPETRTPQIDAECEHAWPPADMMFSNMPA